MSRVSRAEKHSDKLNNFNRFLYCHLNQTRPSILVVSTYNLLSYYEVIIIAIISISSQCLVSRSPQISLSVTVSPISRSCHLTLSPYSGGHPVRSETKDKSGSGKSKSKTSSSSGGTSQKPNKQIVVGSKVGFRIL